MEKQRFKSNQYGNYFAYVLMALSNICLVFMQYNFKRLSKYFMPPTILAVRGSLLFLFNIFMLEHNKIQSHVQDPKIFRLLMKRSLVSFIAVILQMSALKYVPIGIANALINTSPIMTFFIEIFYYKKKNINWINFIFTLVSFIGIIFIIQPSFIFGEQASVNTKSGNIYYFMIIVAAFFSSFSMIFLHDLHEKCHQLVALHHTYIVQALGNSFLSFFIHKTIKSQLPQLQKYSFLQIQKIFLYLILMITFAFASQYLKAKSVYMCSPALVMPFSYLSVIIGLILDIWIFRSHYDYFAIIGMILSCLGLLSKFVMIYIVKKQQKQKEKQILHQN